MKNKKKLIIQLENQIEEGLITAHEYQDPTIFLPYNPIFQLLKKLYLRFLSMYTKYQIVFNQNLFYSVNKIYQYILELNNELEKKDQEIKKLKKELKEIKSKIK